MTLDQQFLPVIFGILIVTVLTGGLSSHNVIYIGHFKVHNVENSTSFETFDEFSRKHEVENFSSIVLMDRLALISSTLVFSRVQGVSISGTNTQVYCMGNNSGIVFRYVNNIEITGVSFLNCGSVQNSTSTDFRDASRSSTLKLKSALYFQYCTNITITASIFENNKGFGVVIYDSNGVTSINECVFIGNKIAHEDSQIFSGGGGVHIEVTSCPAGLVCFNWNDSLYDIDIDNSLFIIEGCKFLNNTASTLFGRNSAYVIHRPVEKQRLGRGGGLYVGTARSASSIKVTIFNCSFTHNNAVFGGAIFMSIKDAVRKNIFSIIDSKFDRNTADKDGGGIVLSFRSSKSTENVFKVVESVFEGNWAPYYGGAVIGTSAGRNNKVLFAQCKWIQNSAHYGAALGVSSRRDISYDKYSIVLDSCYFSKNIVKPQTVYYRNVSHSFYKKAVVSISFEYVNFKQSVVFEDNIGSALLIVASTIVFLPSTVAHFTRNSGYRGGAISLVDNSLMLVNNNSQFYFENNTAVQDGGAIYVESHDERNPYSIADSACPLQFEGQYTAQSNVSFQFVSNHANGEINSVYFTTIDSCVYLCTHNTSASLTVKNIFKCVGELNYSRNSSGEFGTFNYNFHVAPNNHMANGTILAVPGEEFKLLVNVIDQLNNSVDSVYSAAIIPLNGSNIFIDPGYRCVEDSFLKIYGSPNSKGLLRLQNKGFFQFSVELNVSLLPCPPAYKTKYITVTNNLSVESCVCSDQNMLYRGIFCRSNADSISAHAFLIHGYWAGYVNTAIHSFFTCVCPPSFCGYNAVKFSRGYILPSSNSHEVMDSFVCGPHRTGILCGKCQPGRSVYFHSPQYRCIPNKLCNLGWLFYIFSEIVPLTILFLSVLFFNVSFTSGSINGFVLFAQSIDSLMINENTATGRYSNPLVNVFNSICEVVYSFFNLNFFGIKSLSYCLLKGANTLDIIAFKYVTVTYAMLLVVASILIMKRCNVSLKFSAQLKKRGTYVTHGLSAFLILCYAQCVQVSFRLLLATRLYGTGKLPSKELYVYYDGNIVLFSLAHLPYVLPALLCLAIIVIPPPVLLLWHPLGKQLLSVCGLGECVLVKAIDRVLLVNKLKPLLDSFQSCFKDNCRFFAGLHFVYRISLFISLLFGRDTHLYILVHSAVMLLAQASIQPYKRRIHNIVDGLLFANLLFINAISLSMDVKLMNYPDGNVEYHILIASIFQLFLLYLPIICAVAYFIAHLVHQKMSKPKAIDFDPDLPYRLVRSNETSMNEIEPKND